jgi:replication factor A1
MDTHEVSGQGARPTPKKTARPSLATKRDFIADMSPGKFGLSLSVQVLNICAVARREFPNGTVIQVAEILVADETGSAIFSARNEQIEILKNNEQVRIDNGKVEMFETQMRLVVDKWGAIRKEDSETQLDVSKNKEKNMSALEYVFQ